MFYQSSLLSLWYLRLSNNSYALHTVSQVILLELTNLNVNKDLSDHVVFIRMYLNLKIREFNSRVLISKSRIFTTRTLKTKNMSTYCSKKLTQHVGP
jgi:hypothetical protein